GFMQDYPVEKWMREARALGLLAGGGGAARAGAGGARPPRAERPPPPARAARASGAGARRPGAVRGGAPGPHADGGLSVDFRIDAATEKRLEGIRALGRAGVRPLGPEAGRLGRPVPPDHPFYAKLVSLGLGRTRWSGDADPRVTRGAVAREGSGRAALRLAEEMAYWDRGVAVSFPGPGLGAPPLAPL